MKNKNQTLILSAFAAGIVVCGTTVWPALAAPLSCGAVLTSDITLQSDLYCAGPDAALVIGADNITVDLNGHTLTGDGTGVGVDNSGGFASVTIKNGTIAGFSEGIRAIGADGLRVNGVEVIGANGPSAVTAAIHILGGQDVQIGNSAVAVTPQDYGPHAIRLDSVKNVAVQNVSIDGGWIGVSFFSIGGVGEPTTGRVQDCIIRNAFQSGVFMGTTDDASVNDNEISGCTLGMQIGFAPVRNVRVTDNTVHGNAGGIVAVTVVDSLISGNVVTDHPFFGINLRDGCENNVISENVVANNGLRGIVLIWGANYNRISSNAVLDNGLEGISLFLEANVGNQITDNVATGNGVWDLFHNELSTPNFWNDNIYDTKSGADIP